MACYHPIPAKQEGQSVTLWPPIGDANIALPCGKCVGCRTDHATRWATRCIHEASIWKHNCCLTLTYADEHLPKDGALTPRHLTLFIKRLRRHADSPRSTLNRDRGHSIRYLACGEYGTLFTRPHYHMLVFNAGFSDLRPRGKYFSSEKADDLWELGGVTIDPSVTGRAAAYVAQYTLAKQEGDWRKRIGYINIATGEFSKKRHKGFTPYYHPDDHRLPPPFLRMSLKPAIGAAFAHKYPTDLQQGFLVENGRQHAVPRYYREILKKHYPDLDERIQDAMATARLRLAQLQSDKKHPDRLRDQEQIHIRRKQLTETRHKRLST